MPEIAWEDALQGIGMAMSSVASEKNRELLFIGQSVLQTMTSLRVVSLVFREHDPLKITNIYLQQEKIGKKMILRENGGNGA